MTDQTVITPEFRISYPHLFTPTMNTLKTPPEPEYSLVAIFAVGEDLSALVAAAEAAIAERWVGARPRDLRSPFRKAEEKQDPETGDFPAGMAPGAFWLSLRSKYAPGVVDAAVQPIIDPNEIYGGCYCIAQVSAYAYSRGGNSGVSFGLRNVQKIRDGEPFGSSRISAEEVFRPVSGSRAAGGLLS